MTTDVARLSCWLVCLWLATLCKVFAAAPLTIDPHAAKVDLTAHLSFMRDPERRLTISEITERQNDFVPATRRDLITGFNRSAYWLQLTLHNSNSAQLERWLVVGLPKTQHVSFYLRQNDHWAVRESGRRVAPLDRPLASPQPVLPLSLAPGQSAEILVRIDSGGSNDMTATLWQPAAYHQAESRSQFLLALLLGGLLLACTLALLAFVRLREWQYFWLALVLFAVCGVEASRENLIGTYLWPAHLVLPPQSLAVFGALALFGISRIATQALELAERLPVGQRLLLGLSWLAVGSALLSVVWYGYGVLALSLVAVTLHGTILALCVHAWRRGKTNARLFLLAFSLALATETARQLANLGVLPWVGAMNFSTVFYLLASPLILLGLAEQTRQLRERLVVADDLQRAKTAFISHISHELRAPLNTILGYSRMLARGSRKLSLSEATTGIEKATLHVLRLIDELLDEARAAAGMLTLSPAPLALKPWLDDIAVAARVTIESKGNRLVCDFSAGLPNGILADSGRLRQILDNLLSNANRHTRGGTIHLRLDGRSNDGQAQLTFSVTDDGEGIAPEHVATLFEPFARGDTTTPGHGLGLPICRDLLRQMGSTITVTSQVGMGSCFAFSIIVPLALQGPVAAPGLSEHLSVALSSEWPKVLLVDDDPLQLEVLSAMFADAGFVVATALGGKDALASLAHADCDIVLTDQMMPEVDGWGVLQQVRSVASTLPVILLTAAEPCRPSGFPANLQFDAILRKPATPDDLVATALAMLMKTGAGAASLDWKALATLAANGEVSGIDDWLTECRQSGRSCEPVLNWIERALHRLDLPLLEVVARNFHKQA